MKDTLSSQKLKAYNKERPRILAEQGRVKFSTSLDDRKLKELKKVGVDLDKSAGEMIELLIDKYLPVMIQEQSKSKE